MIYIYVASLLDLQEGPNRTYFPGCCVVLSGKGVIPVQAFNRPQYLNRRFIMRSTLPSKLSKFLVALFFVSSMSVSFFAFTGVALAHSTAATTTTTSSHHWSTPTTPRRCAITSGPSIPPAGSPSSATSTTPTTN